MEKHEGAIHHIVDPLRYPRVQKPYEAAAKDAFSATRLFGDMVETMTKILGEEK